MNKPFKTSPRTLHSVKNWIFYNNIRKISNFSKHFTISFISQPVLQYSTLPPYSICNPYGIHMECKYSMESIWNMLVPYGFYMESTWNGDLRVECKDQK